LELKREVKALESVGSDEARRQDRDAIENARIIQKASGY
jgi:hypothetical protein